MGHAFRPQKARFRQPPGPGFSREWPCPILPPPGTLWPGFARRGRDGRTALWQGPESPFQAAGIGGEMKRTCPARCAGQALFMVMAESVQPLKSGTAEGPRGRRMPGAGGCPGRRRCRERLWGPAAGGAYWPLCWSKATHRGRYLSTLTWCSSWVLLKTSSPVEGSPAQKYR